MRHFVRWLWCWATTLRIMLFERETYRFLRDYEFNEDDFEDAPRPGAAS